MRLKSRGKKWKRRAEKTQKTMKMGRQGSAKMKARLNARRKKEVRRLLLAIPLVRRLFDRLFWAA